MPQPIEPRVCRARHYAELSRCLALEAEHDGDPWNAARLELDAMLIDARADRLIRTEGRRA